MIFNYKRRDFLCKILFLVLITTVLLAFICSCTGRANTTSQTLIFNSESKETLDSYSEEKESLISVETELETDTESEIETISESESEISQESEFNQESEREQASESEVEVDSESTEESFPTSENELGSEFESEIESESIEDSITESEEIEVFVVTFQVDNGEEIENQFIEEGNLAVCPPIPTKNGYVFMGWYINDEIFDFSTPIEFSFELVARWEEIKPIGS
ncbi:MAG: InlB B-repeat-containing protein, partial [Clostridia bacterium]|nr:InlB B-repeat-containing protein [Clostridia bacterium]